MAISTTVPGLFTFSIVLAASRQRSDTTLNFKRITIAAFGSGKSTMAINIAALTKKQ